MIYKLDPLIDARWKTFLASHSRATVFHTPGWAEALQKTYSYRPIVFTLSPPGAELTNGILFCHVKSWMTGSRLVSLPFSDHCDPLFENIGDLEYLLHVLAEQVTTGEYDYLELRPLRGALVSSESLPAFQSSSTFCFHKLDLRPAIGSIFHGFHKSCIQRKVKRAEREGLEYRFGRSQELLADFYALLVLTRRIHLLPPPPRAWFQNLIASLGEGLCIHVAYKDSMPVASILTLGYKESVVYKYGCSDVRFNSMGGTPFLMWRAIRQSKERGALEFDMGRTDCENKGLINFKDRFSASRLRLEYLRCVKRPFKMVGQDWKVRSGRWLIKRLPTRFLTATGSVLYRHLG